MAAVAEASAAAAAVGYYISATVIIDGLATGEGLKAHIIR